MTTTRKTQHQEIELLSGDTLIIVTEGNSQKSIIAGITSRLLAVYADTDDDQQRTFIYAFGRLVSNTDIEAVACANEIAKRAGLPTITTREFRLWIPRMLSEFFGEAIK